MLERLKRLVHLVVEPLRADDEIEHFRLSVPETHTTTIDGDVGWGARPPAVLACPDCGSQILQRRSWQPIDCPDCRFEVSNWEFTDVELLAFVCPNCDTPMQDGQRHPHVFDVPEWATCHDCRYHWEYVNAF